jgi:hypothetical protein
MIIYIYIYMYMYIYRKFNTIQLINLKPLESKLNYEISTDII